MDNKKIIMAVYVAGGIITWYVTRSSIMWLYSVFYEVRKFPGILVLRELIPVLTGSVVSGVLFLHPKVNLVLNEVVLELKKVTWPQRDDVVKSTWVVIVCIFIAAAILAVFDVVWGKLISVLLHS